MVCIPRWKPVGDDADWQRLRQTRSPSSTNSFRLGYLLLLVACLIACAACGSKVQVTVKVVDDNNQPVPNAKVVVMGLNTQKEGKTDKDGIFPAKLRNATGQLDFVVRKEGFYTIGWYSYYFTGHTNGQWQPWNPVVELQLRKRGDPRPMVVKHVEEEMPVLDRPVGYDLLKSDWVKPYGHGETSDFLFEARRWSNGPDNVNGWLRLKFLNPGDGLATVKLFWRNDYGLKLAAIAPPNGYRSQWWWSVGSADGPPGKAWIPETNMDQDANYYLRVRTRTGINGEWERGLYGKIYRGISLGLWTYRTNVTIDFLYYLNPDGTRNTEWDVRSNLCPNPGDVGGRP
jgi:hypothetical protein